MTSSTTKSASTNPTSDEVVARIRARTCSRAATLTGEVTHIPASSGSSKNVSTIVQRCTEAFSENPWCSRVACASSAMALVIGMLLGVWMASPESERVTRQTEVLRVREELWTEGLFRRKAEAEVLASRIEAGRAELQRTSTRLAEIRPRLASMEARRAEVLEFESRLPRFRAQNGHWYQLGSWPPVVESSGTMDFVFVRRTTTP